MRLALQLDVEIRTIARRSISRAPYSAATAI